MQNQYVHLITLLIIVGFSVISWVYRKLKDEAAKKRARDMVEERQREILRTGRDPFAAPAEDQGEAQRQRDIAARREAQLAELRRRALARQQTGEARSTPIPAPAPAAPTPAAPRAVPRAPIRSIPGSPGPTVQQRAPVAPVRTAPRPVPARAAARPVKPAKQPRPRQEVRAAIASPEPEESTHRLVPDQGHVRRSPLVSGAAPQTAEEWRRAIIANEILAQPLSLRSQDVSVPF